MLAPIILFAYNRPFHTRQTLEALKLNDLSNESLLYIYCDGAKANESAETLAKIAEVRAIAKSENWCKEVVVVEQSSNLGLADSIVSGVTKIVNQFGKIIVLEDDILTSSGFLRYMNDALHLYENEEKVMHVSGYMFPINCANEKDTFFYNTASCWGWGTWSRAWKYMNTDAAFLLNALTQKKMLKSFNIGGYADFIEQLQLNISGIKKTWAVKWYASFVLQNGFALHPKNTLTLNIGHDNSGENCNASNLYENNVVKSIRVEAIPIQSSKIVYQKMKHFYRMNHAYHKSSKFKKVVFKIINLFYKS
jgi:GR25 family glycosyltransferase involved in LPS biosynthesis